LFEEMLFLRIRVYDLKVELELKFNATQDPLECEFRHVKRFQSKMNELGSFRLSVWKSTAIPEEQQELTVREMLLPEMAHFPLPCTVAFTTVTPCDTVQPVISA
jgi:hypothetical protein